MMWVTCILFSVILHSSCSAPTKPPSKIEQIILKEIEKFRLQMRDGLPEAGIPSMDPLLIPDTDLGPVGVDPFGKLRTAKIEGAEVEGLPDFQVEHIKFKMLSLNMLINMTFPLIQVKGNYKMDGSVLSFIPVYGEGSFVSSIHDVKVSGNAVLGAENKTFFIEKLNLHAEINDFKIKVTGLMGGGALGNTVNTLVEVFGAKVVRQMAPTVANMLADFARLRANSVMKNMDLSKFLG